MSNVTLTIDGREVTVPAGIGLVEAAAELGVEIPVFCYEPRIGPPVGACRMCLVEIEGVPKLQAACATGVRPGMVVSTQSNRAREAQEAVLEFLLVNHPLDCPVCDKGGECPLQDHAFRWGPGASRFQELKRVNDKPIPVSPLIALDRERCILCYRCTRFSEEVTEDLQLVARQRGANSVIATFEGRPWEGTHSGNVIELCPVGALTSTQYRFRARPWEAPDHPSIAGWDPVGSNTYNTVREDEVVRVISRRNDSVDVGWIDDRTRFAYTSMYGPSRIRLPQLRAGDALVDASMEVALEWLHDRLAAPAADDVAARDAAQEAGEAEPAASARELWVLSGTETLETAFAIQQLAALTGGRAVAVPGASAAAPAASATIADLGAARHVLVVGDTDLLDDAPALDLWVRTARKNGASVTAAGIGGTRLEQAGAHLEHVAPGELDAWAIGFADRIAKAAGSTGAMEEPGVIVYRDGELSDAALERLATTFSFPREGSGFLAIPSAPNARGLAALDIETAGWDEILRHDGGVIYVGVDPLRFVTEAAWKGAAATWTAALDTLPSPLHATADLVIPGAWTGEQDGTLVNLEGRLQRLTVGVEPPVKSPLQWIAGLARRFGNPGAVGHAAGAFRRIAAAHPDRFPAAGHGDIPAEGILGVSGGTPAPHRAAAAVTPGAEELAIYVAPFLYDAAEVAHSEAMGFLRDEAKLLLNRTDARERGLARGAAATITIDGRDVAVTINTSTRIAPGVARVHAGTPGLKPGHTGWHASTVRPVAAAQLAEQGA